MSLVEKNQQSVEDLSHKLFEETTIIETKSQTLTATCHSQEPVAVTETTLPSPPPTQKTALIGNHSCRWDKDKDRTT
jgi:hypothetical protein